MQILEEEILTIGSVCMKGILRSESRDPNDRKSVAAHSFDAAHDLL